MGNELDLGQRATTRVSIIAPSRENGALLHGHRWGITLESIISVDGSHAALCHEVALHQRFKPLPLPLQQRLVAAAARLGVERVMPLLFRGQAGVPGCCMRPGCLPGCCMGGGTRRRR